MIDKHIVVDKLRTAAVRTLTFILMIVFILIFSGIAFILGNFGKDIDCWGWGEMVSAWCDYPEDTIGG